jgi:hypothetical protein
MLPLYLLLKLDQQVTLVKVTFQLFINGSAKIIIGNNSSSRYRATCATTNRITPGGISALHKFGM